MKSGKFDSRRLALTCVAAAGVLGALSFQQAFAGAAEDAAAAPDAAARAIWREAMELYVPLQANEAAALHPEPRDGFELVIAERLRWGALLAPNELAELRKRLANLSRLDVTPWFII